MIKFKFYLLFVVLSSLLVGCHTITFVQYEQPGEHTTVNRWHHSTLNGTVEISQPLNIRTICEKRAWTKITTELTFYNIAVMAVVPTLPPVSFYTAWTNKVQCHEPPNTIDL